MYISGIPTQKRWICWFLSSMGELQERLWGCKWRVLARYVIAFLLDIENFFLVKHWFWKFYNNFCVFCFLFCGVGGGGEVNSPIGMKIEIFFLGNDHLHQLTKLGISDLYVRLEKFTGGWTYARYNNFSVADESDGYRMRVKVGSYHGSAGT